MSKHILRASLLLLTFSHITHAQDISAVYSHELVPVHPCRLKPALAAKDPFLCDYDSERLKKPYGTFTPEQQALFTLTRRVAYIIGLRLAEEQSHEDALRQLKNLLDAGLSPYLVTDICLEEDARNASRDSWYSYVLEAVIRLTPVKTDASVLDEDIFAEDLYAESFTFGLEVSPFSDRSSTTMCPSSPEEQEAGLSIRRPVDLAPSTLPSDVVTPNSMRLACEPGQVSSSPSRDSEFLLAAPESRYSLMRTILRSACLGRATTLQYRMSLLMQMNSLVRPTVILGTTD
jgi:hypothetical protein